jgi:hypothetical protein
MVLQFLDGLHRGKDQQLNFAPFRFVLDRLHNWKGAGPCTNHKAATAPRDFFFQGKGRVSKSLPEFLGRFFHTFPDFAVVNHNVMLVGYAINSD